MDIYRHVGAKVRNDLQRRGLPESRYVMWEWLGGVATCNAQIVSNHGEI